MNKLLYQSLYSDHDLTGLKHCLFYFDSIDIPDLEAPIFWGENNANVRFLQTVPERVYNDIEYLRKEGVVHLVRVQDKPWENIFETCQLIINEIDRNQKKRLYEPSVIHELCDFVGIHEKDPELLETVDQVSIFLASICITSLSMKEQVCCIDNKLIFDSLNLGINRIIKSKLSSYDIDSHQIKRWKANLLAQEVISLNLPSFEFHSFDDVLELKLKFRENLLALDNHLVDISSDIDGMPWELNFQHRMTDYINKKIQPDISNLRKNVKSFPLKIANRIYDTGFSNLGLSLAFYSLSPSHLKEILIGASAKTLLDIIKTSCLEEKKDGASSPYSIFMKVRKT